jgi:hypothetical protein
MIRACFRCTLIYKTNYIVCFPYRSICLIGGEQWKIEVMKNKRTRTDQLY